MRPPFPYFGGKQSLAAAIAALLPEHEHYVEPFAGSLAVLLAKPPSRMETVNDLDGDLMTWWRVLRDQPAELEGVCRLTPHSRAEHAAALASVGEQLPDLERARRVWVLLTQGRSGGTARATGWRHFQGGGSLSMPSYLDAYSARIDACAGRLRGVSLECRPAHEVIAAYGRSPDTLLYVDPPYLGSTRAANRGYRHEMKEPGRHAELAEALRGCAAAVVLSGYPSELYDRDLYAGWHRVELAAGTGNGGQWRDRVEVLWSNRPLGQQSALDFGEVAS